MRLRKTIIRTGILSIPFIIGLTSCEEKLYYGTVDCSECYQIKPDSADLIVNLTANGIYRAVPLTFYRGNIETGQVEYVDTAYTSPYYLWVAVNRYYSVKAEYARGNTVIYAVDGTEIEVLKVPDACDKECYIIRHESLDVELNARYQ
jgi:hypothetical protein